MRGNQRGVDEGVVDADGEDPAADEHRGNALSPRPVAARKLGPRLVSDIDSPGSGGFAEEAGAGIEVDGEGQVGGAARSVDVTSAAGHVETEGAVIVDVFVEHRGDAREL